MKHRTKLEGSKRLQRVMDALREAGPVGLTTYQLLWRARVTDVKDVIYELRCQGFEISSEMVKVGEGQVARYRLIGSRPLSQSSFLAEQA